MNQERQQLLNNACYFFPYALCFLLFLKLLAGRHSDSTPDNYCCLFPLCVCSSECTDWLQGSKKYCTYSVWKLFQSQLRQLNVNEILYSPFGLFKLHHMEFGCKQHEQIHLQRAIPVSLWSSPIIPKYFGTSRERKSRVVHPQKKLHAQFRNSAVKYCGPDRVLEARSPICRQLENA